VIRYEDLRADTPRELRRLATFLELAPSDAIVDAVVEYAAFENMKQREAERVSDSDRLRATDVSNPDSFKTRRGKVGGWSDYFDDAQCAEIDRVVETTLHPSYGYRGAAAAAASRVVS
jgi:alcohol sulfotransferase